MFIKELIRLTRFEHAIMLAFAVLIAETVVLGAFPPLSIIIVLSLAVPVFSEMGSFALNDYLDIETDRMNKKTDRPLVRGTISPGFALWFSVSCLALSVVLALFINTAALVIALIFNALAMMYNWKLKDLPLVGNIYIALTMAIPFLFGNFVVSGELSQVALILALLGFVAGLAREIIKSAQDMEGDMKARGSKTLPVLIGRGPAMGIAILLYLTFLPLSAIPFYLGMAFGILPGILVGAADALILAICFKSASGDYRFARNASLVAFSLGMLGILVAAL
jgi:geranylgeranylglycerol-phosphate geranylgeranyltransferase